MGGWDVGCGMREAGGVVVWGLLCEPGVCGWAGVGQGLAFHQCPSKRVKSIIMWQFSIEETEHQCVIFHNQ